jgi:hypothetical protein
MKALSLMVASHYARDIKADKKNDKVRGTVGGCPVTAWEHLLRLRASDGGATLCMVVVEQRQYMELD